MTFVVRRAVRRTAFAFALLSVSGTFVQDWEYVEGLGDLDECNGRTGEVVVRGTTMTTYHYFITHAFPYIPRCFKATPDPSFDPRVSPPGG